MELLSFDIISDESLLVVLYTNSCNVGNACEIIIA